MNKPLVRDFLLFTFSIMLVFWGACVAICQCSELTVNHIFLRILHLTGGFSPTVASYISLKKHGQVRSFREWLGKIFDIRHKGIIYAIVALFVGIYYFLGCLLNGFRLGAPIYSVLVIVPLMLFGGGNEEAGWRMILQPQLEKSLGFHPATLLTGLIWWLWHLPLFFMKGTAQADMNFFLFGLMCLSLSYALGAVSRLSKGVFPCILTHCLINGLSAIFVFSPGWLSVFVTLLASLGAAVLLLLAERRFSESHG